MTALLQLSQFFLWGGEAREGESASAVLTARERSGSIGR